MRIIIILTTFMFGLATLANGQEPENIPSAPATPVVRDNNIKMRSVELERVKRELIKKDPDSVRVNEDIDKKYPEIKEDFEGIQLSQAAIIKAYTTGTTIDYAMIESSANQISKNAKRLRSNLFPEKVKEEDKEKVNQQTKSVRDLIIDLDEAIGKVSTSKMFVNLRVIDPKISSETQDDLENVIKLSSELSEASKKLK